MAEPFDGATGALVRFVPEGPERDEILSLIRLGEQFRAQQVGKRPGPLARLVLDCARRAGPQWSFAAVLDQLELEAARREINGERASPVEKLDRIFELVTLHMKRGRVQVPFASLRRHLTAAKIILRAEIRAVP